MALAVWSNELTCCICLDLYSEPVTLLCGHSFCKECIRDTFETQEGHGFYSCPECRANFKTRPLLQRNLRLCNIVETFQTTPSEKDNAIPCTYCIHSIVPAVKTCLNCEASLCAVHLKVHQTSPDHMLTEPTACLKDRKCSDHRKILEYYCTDDASFICVSCRLDGDHSRHSVETLHEASEKKKKELRTLLKKLNSRKKQVEEKIQVLTERKRRIHDATVALTERTTGFFKEIIEQVKALENEVVGEISRQEERVSLSVSDLIHQLEIQNGELLWKILEVERFCANMDPLGVLRERSPCYDLTSGDSPLPDTGGLDEGPVSLILHNGLQHVVKLSNEGAMRRFPETLERCKVPLDVTTAHHKILISSDLLCASSSRNSLKYPDRLERFRSRQVLSSSRFSSGRHYWEVDVRKAQKWIIGVVYNSIERKVDGDNSYIGYNDKSWGLTFRKYLSALYNKTHWKIPLEPPPKTVGVYLDYEAGRLSFYGLQPSRHLHTFSTTFSEALHPAFYVFEDSYIRIKQ